MLRDALEDVAMGYLNIPCEFLDAHGLDPYDVNSDAYRIWVKHRVQLARVYFKAGKADLAQFEGYFVGIHHSVEEMVTQLLQIGHGMLTSNCRLYGHQYTFKAKLMKTLHGELNDPRAIDAWSASLGATLARLRCNIYYNYEIYRFQNETYWAVNRLPFINYIQCEHRIEQEYTLALFKRGCASKPDFCLHMLNPSDYEAGCVALMIGRFGHPLIRAYLREVDRCWGYAN